MTRWAPQNEPIAQCDFLIVGDGSAGCIVAKRLAEKTRGRIIRIEAGRSDESDPAAHYLNRLDDQTADYDWGYMASPHAAARSELDDARPKILGGCGNHNDCATFRASGTICP